MNTRISSLLLVIAVLTSGCFKVSHDHQHQHVHHKGKPQSSSMCMTKPHQRSKLIEAVSLCTNDDDSLCKYTVEHVIQADSAFKGGYIVMRQPSEKELENTSDDFIVEMFSEADPLQNSKKSKKKRELRRNEEEICIEPVPGNKNLIKITYPFEKDEASHELVMYVFNAVGEGENNAKFFYYIQHTKGYFHGGNKAHDESAGSGSKN